MKGEKDRVKELEAEIKKLKISAADAVLAKDALETLVEIVDKHYQTDVKKIRTAAIGQNSRSKRVLLKEGLFLFWL